MASFDARSDIRRGLLTTAGGKVLLAELPEVELEAYLRRRAPQERADVEAFLDACPAIRESRVAVNVRQTPSRTGVATVIRDPSGQVVASVTLVGSTPQVLPGWTRSANYCGSGPTSGANGRPQHRESRSELRDTHPVAHAMGSVRRRPHADRAPPRMWPAGDLSVHRGSTRMVVARAGGLLMRAIAAVEPWYLRAYSASTAGSTSGCPVALTAIQVTSQTTTRAWIRP